MNQVKRGRYRHYKNILVRVIGVAIHSETHEELVVYEKLERSDDYPAGTLFVRPKAMFLETVTRDGYKGPRFTYIE